MGYRCVVATALGGPDVLQVAERRLRPPTGNEVRIRVIAASIGGPDLGARRGDTLFAGTRLGHRPPFVPGYSVIGDVDALGPDARGVAVGDRVGVLCVVGGWTEILYWRADRLIPVPGDVDPIAAMPLLLNYVVAYQSLHRKANVRTGERALIIGAAGGIGTALVQLGKLATLELYGLDTGVKRAAVEEHGATAIDVMADDFVDVIRAVRPDGLDVVVDSTMRLDVLRRSLSLLRDGGRLVSFGDPRTPKNLARALALAASVDLRPNRRSFKLYGTSPYTLGFGRTFLEDWATLFALLRGGHIRPVIHQRFPLLDAADANRLLETGSVIGNLVLVADPTEPS